LRPLLNVAVDSWTNQSAEVDRLAEVGRAALARESEGVNGAIEVLDPNSPRRSRIVLVACIAVAGFVLLLLLGAFFVLLWYTSRMLRRQAGFWWKAGPILLAYRWFLWKVRLDASVVFEEEEQRALDQLHEQYAPKALEIVQSMGGMFLKMAQVASNNPMIPLAYRQQFAKCCDQNIPMDFYYVRKAIEAALRRSRPAKLSSRKLEDVFSYFDETPLGVASIGQVHRARLAKSGREVAIKVKFPDVEDLFMADFASLKVLARVARSQWAVPLIEEFSQQISQEFNYEQEALNLDTMRNILMPRFEDKLEVPAICRDLTTDSVLTMTYVEGTRLDVALKQRLQAAGIDAARLEKVVLFGPGQTDVTEDAVLSTESASPLAAPKAVARQAPRWRPMTRLSERTSGWMLGVVLAALRFKSSFDHCFHGFRASVSSGSGSGSSGHPSQRCTDAAAALAQADVRAMLGTLLDVWGYSMLQVGTFHGDPHPGNVLLKKGSRLGLLDYGQVVTLPTATQRKLAELMLALADGDEASTISLVQGLGFEMEQEERGGPASVDPPELEFAKLIFGGVVPTLDQRVRMIRSIRKAPSDLFFVIRCAVILRGVGLGLGHSVNLADSWKKWAKAFLNTEAKQASQETADEEEAEADEPQQA